MKNKKTLQIKIIFTLLLASMFSLAGYSRSQAAEGDVWLIPVSQTLGASENFDIEVHMDTGGKKLGVFNMYFDFYTDNIAINTDQGDNGADKGADVSSYSVIVNADDISNGHLRFGGMTASGYADGSDVHLVTIHAKTTSNFASGTASLSLQINELANELGAVLDSGTVAGATIVSEGGAVQTYNISNFTQLESNWLGSGNAESDVNSDGIVNTRDLGIMMSNWE